MFGAVYGDIIGSYYEVHATKQMDFPLFVPQSTFTDDTVMTAAVCETLLAGRRPASGFLERRHRAREYACRYRQYYARYPSAGFGEMFRAWAEKPELTGSAATATARRCGLCRSHMPAPRWKRCCGRPG